MTWHIVTGEYPPTLGGVADHSRLLAEGLVQRGSEVHVWCPGHARIALERGVVVHRTAGTWSAADTSRVAVEMRRAPDGTVLVQWVPHAYGRKSLNVAFCRFVRRLAREGRNVELLVHEPFLAFHEGSWKQDGAAVVHRAMAVILFGAASRIWVAIPAWEGRVRPWLLGRHVPISWLPVPSNVTVIDAPPANDLRARYLGRSRVVVGHFGTFGRATREPLQAVLRRVLARDEGISVLLIGRDGESFRDELCAATDGASGRVHATGALDERSVSWHLQACDLAVQPYIDGASTRRGTLMACLAHGLPVVTCIGRLSEPLWAEENGRSVVAAAAGDGDALSDAVLRLAANHDERIRLAAAARQLYESRFTVEHAISSLLAGRAAA